MSSVQTDYHWTFAAAFVRGKLSDTDLLELEPELFTTPLSKLSDEQTQRLVNLGKERGLKLHKFKKTMGLQRVQSVLGVLRGLQPSELLDIGTGRGVFLWPFLDAFPLVPITCVDMNAMRVRDLKAAHNGGIDLLDAVESDIAKLELPAHSFDVVTFLEALEHIPEPQAALEKAMQMARRSLILSVPSHEDDNEEHIHFFTKDSLNTMLLNAGARRVNIQYVLNHIIAVASREQISRELCK